jgi:hypothetical protein
MKAIFPGFGTLQRGDYSPKKSLIAQQNRMIAERGPYV